MTNENVARYEECIADIDEYSEARRESFEIFRRNVENGELAPDEESTFLRIFDGDEE